MPAHRAFGPDDYPDPRSEGERAAERGEVERQVGHLERMARDSDYRATVMSTVLERQQNIAETLHVEAYPRHGRYDLLVDADSVVSWGEDRARTAESGHPHRPVRLGVSDADRAEGGIARYVESCCAGGHRVQVNHIPLLAGVMKGPGGPEPSAGGVREYGSFGYDAASLPVVAVIDTGISSEQRADGYLGMPVAPEDLDPLDVQPLNGLLDEGAGHGAFVTGVIEQVAPGTPVKVHRVFVRGGMTTDTLIADKICEAATDDVKIINISLGTETVDDEPPPAMSAVIEELRQSRPDLLIVCAAGNGAGPERVWPAALAATNPNVVAVGGLTSAGEGAGWSTRGGWVTCSAIGEGVVSTYVVGTEDAGLIGDSDPDTYGENSWAVWSGTSFSAPQITGAIARICAEEGIEPTAALPRLLERGTTIGNYGTALQILPGT